MTTVAGADVEPRTWVAGITLAVLSAVNTAVIECVPWASAVVLRAATPDPLIATGEPRLVAPSLNCTAPASVATLPDLVTVVVSVTLPPTSAAVGAAITLLGSWLCGEAEKTLGRDAHPIVLDEVAGQLITLALARRSLLAAAVGFVLFRILDVWKPPPACQAQKLPGGLGVVMDDVIAGLYGFLLMRGAALALHLPI